LTAVFHDVQAMWAQDFAAAGVHYTPAMLTIFRYAVHTACGTQGASVGPFYCPADHGVYLDTRFFNALALHAGVTLGDFAQAYVIAHEVGHHVQLLLGVHARVARENHDDPAGANARSVLVELQADCYAGVWLHTVAQRGELSDADLADILRAAAIVGDDYRRERAGVELAPETWTHGSSAQRTHWLSVGYRTGDPGQCDTFNEEA
jgi:uncharacterized protein